jgi:hypothetical protein
MVVAQMHWSQAAQQGVTSASAAAQVDLNEWASQP